MSVQIKLVHEVTCILHSLLAALLLVCLVIELNRTISLVSNLEEINTSVTLHSMSRESTLLSTCNSTRESRLASASSCDEYRSSESNLVYRRNLTTLALAAAMFLTPFNLASIISAFLSLSTSALTVSLTTASFKSR